MALKLFSGLENKTGELAAGDKVVVEDVSSGELGYVLAPSLGSLKKITTLADEAATLTVAQAGICLMPNSVARTLTLPTAAAGVGLEYTIVKTTAAAAAITIEGDGAETINGNANFASCDAQYDTVSMVSDGTEWWITHKIIA